MPDTRKHRGAHPEDAKLFSAGREPDLLAAVRDLSMLFGRGYAEKSSLKLVGDRFNLTERQRMAVLRSSCSDEQVAARRARLLQISDVRGMGIAIDGYNLLITIEAAMGSGLVFIGRDGVCRDIASIHGTYRKVTETVPAVETIGAFLEEKGAGVVEWILDSPVSNSGRLKALIEGIARKSGWEWEARLAANPDKYLVETQRVVATSDGFVLDRCGRWVNLARSVMNEKIPLARIVDFSS